MNPMKIGIRMMTTLITEPIVTVSGTVKIIIHGITGEFTLHYYAKFTYKISLLFIIVFRPHRILLFLHIQNFLFLDKLFFIVKI